MWLLRGAEAEGAALAELLSCPGSVPAPASTGAAVPSSQSKDPQRKGTRTVGLNRPNPDGFRFEPSSLLRSEGLVMA